MGRRLQTAEFAAAVSAAQADIVQAEAIEMVQYLENSRAARIFDCHNAEWLLQKRTFQLDMRRGRPVGAAYSFLQWLKLRAYERRACQRSAAVIAVRPTRMAS